MDKKEIDQVLVIEPPHELAFVGPFTSPVSSIMKLTNPVVQKICFKIKTTAPKRYCVKPNSGVIDPLQTVQISVNLQPFEYDPNEKNRHKFMVQSMYAPEGEFNQDTLWKETDSAKLMDSKLKCVFVLPEDSQPAGDGKLDYSSSKQISNGPQSPKMSDEVVNDVHFKSSVVEVLKLQEEASLLRQENSKLKEEAVRQKWLLSNKSGEQLGSSSRNCDYSANLVTPANPNASALSSAHVCAALLILSIGVMIGKWIF